jgi:hypothetical protein
MVGVQLTYGAARAALFVCLCLTTAATAGPSKASEADRRPAADFAALPLPPEIDRLYDLSPDLPRGRDTYLARLHSAAEEVGLPPALADAVALVESRYDPYARGGDGEVGLMQILPTTAAMLGHRGSLAELFDPEVNIRYGVRYLAKAWQLAEGDLCRALMKYRAGHGEERMTALSIRYCARARAHLATIGSPLISGSGSIDPKLMTALAALETAGPRPQAGGYKRGRVRTKSESRRFWAAHEKRIRAINAKLSASRLRVMSGT